MFVLSKKGNPWIFWIVAGCVGAGFGYAAQYLRFTETPVPTHGDSVAATQYARDLLACYAQRLDELAKTADVFATAALNDVAELRAAAAPLGPGIDAVNQAYIRLSTARLRTSLVMLSKANTHASDYYCRLKSVEQYQWHEYRPLMNGLLVNLLVAWRHTVGADYLADIQHQQRNEWQQVVSLLKNGAERFRVEASADACAAKAPVDPGI